MTPIEPASPEAILQPIAERAWLWLDRAFGLWADRGLDRQNGGCRERLTLAAEPTGHARRAFVQARQAYCFCEAGRLGWAGPWREAALHAGASLRDRYVQPDGSILHALDAGGATVDPSTDLYDAAFALFGLAHLYGHAGQDPRDREAAEAILAYLRRERAHPKIGFVEHAGETLRQNPHMHLFEAAIAWFAATRDDLWRSLAEELETLAERHLRDPETGAILEHFAADWTPLDGRQAAIVEPGHQYEWAYLLAEWDRERGRPPRPACTHLFVLAEQHGRDPGRGVAIHDLDIALRPRHRGARIWAQTERLRAAITLWPHLGLPARAAAVAAAVEAGLALERFLDTPIPGLWRDKWSVDGSFVLEDVPASSFYHLVGGYGALLRRCGPRRFQEFPPAALMPTS